MTKWHFQINWLHGFPVRSIKETSYVTFEGSHELKRTLISTGQSLLPKWYLLITQVRIYIGAAYLVNVLLEYFDVTMIPILQLTCDCVDC